MIARKVAYSQPRAMCLVRGDYVINWRTNAFYDNKRYTIVWRDAGTIPGFAFIRIRYTAMQALYLSSVRNIYGTYRHGPTTASQCFVFNLSCVLVASPLKPEPSTLLILGVFLSRG